MLKQIPYYHTRRITAEGFMPVKVTRFNARGLYPDATVRTPSSVFYADKTSAFLITSGPHWDSILSEPTYSEFDWASPEEFRTLASIMLCEDVDGPPVRFYPKIGSSYFLAAEPDFSFTTADIADIVANLGAAESAMSSFSDVECSGSFDLISESQLALSKQPRFWKKIEYNDVLLARGICSLIKTDMLASHREFGEEALLSAFIALDASFVLVCERLTHEGVKNPTAADAAQWLHQHFDSKFGHESPTKLDKYFQEFYEDRVMTLHPSSRFGRFPYAPAMHDDFVHLRSVLRHVFSFLVLGELDASFVQASRRLSFE